MKLRRQWHRRQRIRKFNYRTKRRLRRTQVGYFLLREIHDAIDFEFLVFGGRNLMYENNYDSDNNETSHSKGSQVIQ